jgi:hypothetical protein
MPFSYYTPLFFYHQKRKSEKNPAIFSKMDGKLDVWLKSTELCHNVDH